MPLVIFSAGLSIVLIAAATLLGWLIPVPIMTTWLSGSNPMAPAAAVSFAAIGTSLMMCGRQVQRRCGPGIVVSLTVLAGSATVLWLRLSGRYSSWEHLGIAISGTNAGRPIGLMSPFTAANILAASIAFLTQLVDGIHRKVRLVTALSAAVVTTATGFATLLTKLLGSPLIAGPATITVAVNTSIALLLLGIGLAAIGIRLADRTSRRGVAPDRSWRPLALAFVAVFALTVAAGYAFYLQEEREIRSEMETRLDGIEFVAARDMPSLRTKHAAAGLEVRTRQIPESDRSLMSITDGRELQAALWERLRWVVSLAAMLLVSAAAILSLVWRTHRAQQYRNRAELAEAVRIQATRTSELAARSPAVLYTLKASGSGWVPTNLSSNVERILGYTLAEAFDRNWFPSHLFPGDAAAALAAPAALATADEVVNEFRFIRKDGTVLWISNQMTVTRREGGMPVEITGAWHDVTARRAAEGALRDSEERLRLALSSAAQGLWDLNVLTGRTIVSSEYASMLGYDPAEFEETNAGWRSRLHPDDIQQSAVLFADYVEGRRADYSTEYRLRTQAGDWRWILSRGRIISRTADGRAHRVLGIHTDITAQKGAELRAEALLKELHHRVKNNLQVISSLLRLEKDRHTDVAVKSAMAEMQLRILSMALLHETLYQSNDLARVDLAVYLTDLAHQVFRSAAPSTGAVSLRTNLASVFVDMDRAIPSGLLVNEVLSNCLKHAFPNGRAGTVTLDLAPAAESSSYVLRITDTGVGLPADFEARQSTSLGVHLIKALASQLNAMLTIDPGPGASFSIAFSPGDIATQEPS